METTENSEEHGGSRFPETYSPTLRMGSAGYSENSWYQATPCDVSAGRGFMVTAVIISKLTYRRGLW
jgi:hypothetical protein